MIQINAIDFSLLRDRRTHMSICSKDHRAHLDFIQERLARRVIPHTRLDARDNDFLDQLQALPLKEGELRAVLIQDVDSLSEDQLIKLHAFAFNGVLPGGSQVPKDSVWLVLGMSDIDASDFTDSLLERTALFA